MDVIETRTSQYYQKTSHTQPGKCASVDNKVAVNSSPAPLNDGVDIEWCDWLVSDSSDDFKTYTAKR